MSQYLNFDISISLIWIQSTDHWNLDLFLSHQINFHPLSKNLIPTHSNYFLMSISKFQYFNIIDIPIQTIGTWISAFHISLIFQPLLEISSQYRYIFSPKEQSHFKWTFSVKISTNWNKLRSSLQYSVMFDVWSHLFGWSVKEMHLKVLKDRSIWCKWLCKRNVIFVLLGNFRQFPGLGAIQQQDSPKKITY